MSSMAIMLMKRLNLKRSIFPSTGILVMADNQSNQMKEPHSRGTFKVVIVYYKYL